MKQYVSIVVDDQLIWSGMVGDTKMRQEMMLLAKPHKFPVANFDIDHPINFDPIQTETIPKVTVEMITWQGDTVFPKVAVTAYNPPKAALPEMDPIQIAEVLEKTAEVLERDGWCQAQAHKTEYVDVPVDDEGVVVR